MFSVGHTATASIPPEMDPVISATIGFFFFGSLMVVDGCGRRVDGFDGMLRRIISLERAAKKARGFRKGRRFVLYKLFMRWADEGGWQC